jgi:hypothetical protein
MMAGVACMLAVVAIHAAMQLPTMRMTVVGLTTTLPPA